MINVFLFGIVAALFSAISISELEKHYVLAQEAVSIAPESSKPSASQSDQSANEVDWMKICLFVQPALYKSCNEYIDDKRVLTTEWEKAILCIRDGAIIGLGAVKFGLPPILVFPGLDTLAEMKGCNGIVNLQVLNTLDLPLILKLFE